MLGSGVEIHVRFYARLVSSRSAKARIVESPGSSFRTLHTQDRSRRRRDPREADRLLTALDSFQVNAARTSRTVHEPTAIGTLDGRSSNVNQRSCDLYVAATYRRLSTFANRIANIFFFFQNLLNICHGYHTVFLSPIILFLCSMYNGFVLFSSTAALVR